jgi:hypothetical protein
MHDLDNLVHVLVGRRLLFGQAAPAPRPGHDTNLGQFAIDAPSFGILGSCGAAHGPARAVAGGPTHVSGNQHRLTDMPIGLRYLGVTRRERSRRALAMDPNTFGLPENLVFLQLGDIVGHVVDELHAQLLPWATEVLGEDLAGLPHQ